jgi:hypothetical protein
MIYNLVVFTKSLNMMIHRDTTALAALEHLSYIYVYIRAIMATYMDSSSTQPGPKL